MLQKKAIRYVENLSCNDHTGLCFLEHSILQVDELFELKLLCHIFKEYKLYPSKYLELHSSSNAPYKLTHNNYRMPLVRTNYGTHMISYLIPSILNKYTQAMKITQKYASEKTFEKKASYHLLSCSSD